MEVFAVWEVPRGFGLDALKEMVFGERVRITEYWNFCLIALGFGALGRCQSSSKLRQEGSRKVLKPLSLGNPQSEQSWGFALPRLNSFIPILEYQLTGHSGPFFPFVQQRSLLYFGSPGPIPITGAASHLCGVGWGIPGLKFPFPTDDVHATDGRQVCRRHELYVSFQDLGWLVLVCWEK